MGRPHKCPYCGSHKNTSKGVRKTKMLGIRKLRFCKNCNRKFTPQSQKFVEASDNTDAEMLAQQIEQADPELNQKPESSEAPKLPGLY